MGEGTIALVEDWLYGCLEIDGQFWKELPMTEGEAVGSIVDHSDGRNRYIGYLISLVLHSFKGKWVTLDCANGSD